MGPFVSRSTWQLGQATHIEYDWYLGLNKKNSLASVYPIGFVLRFVCAPKFTSVYRNPKINIK